LLATLEFRLDTGEGLLKLLMISTNLFRGRAYLILLNARCKEGTHGETVFRDGLHFPGLFIQGVRMWAGFRRLGMWFIDGILVNTIMSVGAHRNRSIP
jgi:hypothetical protein